MPVYDITSHLIKQKYTMIKASCELNQNMGKIYSLTPHPIRYNCLNYLKLLSLPISLAFYITKLCFTANPSWTWIGVNILHKKMGQATAKKILHGLPDEVEPDQNIPKIVEYVFRQYEENPTLTPIIEPTLIQKFLAKASKYIPALSRIVKFWNEGGINYSDEIQTKRALIDVIYKHIIAKAYEVGKKGGKLEITDVTALFPEINFEEKVNTASANLETEQVEVSNEESLISELPVRHLSKPAYREEFKRDTEHSTAAYIDIREDASTGSTSKLPLEVKFGNMSIDQKHEEATITTNANNSINPLVNLLMLKALHDAIRQEVLKTYVEHCLAEIQISKNQETLKNFQYDDSLAKLQLYGNYDNNNTYIFEQPVSYLGQPYEHLTAPIACY
ncbi:palindromic element RPE1 domain-containing protein [Rickettsia parkeri]|uniref:palindromic element RPE1 domain-containing protein n=1 Tax=Rickettsia parkeri TaxID=35792 RepID=UPI0010FBD3BF|nr:palindromic element RPE1 domain-containing protein [Rickettsia parkeri]QCS23913.1 palindromic element RPE1 domain-containing protein [Rickettsia parkeri]